MLLQIPPISGDWPLDCPSQSPAHAFTRGWQTGLGLVSKVRNPEKGTMPILETAGKVVECFQRGLTVLEFSLPGLPRFSRSPGHSSEAPSNTSFQLFLVQLSAEKHVPFHLLRP
jgi:hypothetical protein